MNWRTLLNRQGTLLTELQAKLDQALSASRAATERADHWSNHVSKTEALLHSQQAQLLDAVEQRDEAQAEASRAKLEAGQLRAEAGILKEERDQSRAGYAQVVESFERKIEQLKGERDLARIARGEALECMDGMKTRAELALAVLNGERDDLAAANDIAQRVRPVVPVHRHEVWVAGETEAVLMSAHLDEQPDWSTVVQQRVPGLRRASGPFGQRVMKTAMGRTIYQTKEEAEAHLG